MSETTQIKRTPGHWVEIQFDLLFQNMTSSSRKLPKGSYASRGKYPVIDQGEDFVGGYTDEETLVHPGPVPAVVFGDHTRCVKYMDTPFVQGADGVKVLAPSPATYAKYAYWALKSSNIPSKGYARHFSLLRKLCFPLPPAGEQQHIVEAIESYFTRLDDAVTSLERVQRNLRRYRASVLKAAVEGRLVPTEAKLARAEGREYEPASVLLKRILAERRRRWEEAQLAKMRAKGKVPKDDRWQAKYGEPVAAEPMSLPALPEGWCWATVDQLAEVGTGATPKRGDPRYWSNGQVPWVTSSVVNQRLVSEPTELVSDAALQETNLTLYPSGTVLVAMYGEGKTRGRATVLGIESTTNQALAALVLPGPCAELRAWILLFLEYNYLELRRAASGGVQPNLNLSIIRGICVPLPPIAEQLRICEVVDRSSSLDRSIEHAASVCIRRATRLRQSILKWAFEGKLVDQDPSDEPASVLLERIKAERAAATPTKKPGRRPRRKKVTA